MALRPGREGRPWRRARAAVLARSTTCWLCGHPGSQDVDHVEALTLGGDPLDPRNLRPAHGVQGCPTCGRKCNQSRGTGVPRRQRQRYPGTSRQW